MEDNYNKFRKSIGGYTFLTSSILILFLTIILFGLLGANDLYQSTNQELEVNNDIDATNPARNRDGFQKVGIRMDIGGNTDSVMRSYLKDLYPLISDNSVEGIITKKSISKILVNDTLGIVVIDAVIYIPKFYFDPNPEILWVLNLPEFKSRFYQIYERDTILIDTWDCSVGNPRTRTYSGYFRVFKMRNWPSWKDPGSDSPPVPPGPYNPLGLFTVHFDRNSTRQFHGTNIDNVQINSYGAVSHGCIRNINENIAKLKEWVIKKIIKSEDLSYWLESKQSMIFELQEEDVLPITIMYKTFDINKDETGDYIIFFKDVYGYETQRARDADDPSLITTATLENILGELRREYPSNNISEVELVSILQKLISEHENFQKYYFKDLVSQYDV